MKVIFILSKLLIYVNRILNKILRHQIVGVCFGNYKAYLYKAIRLYEEHFPHNFEFLFV